MFGLSSHTLLKIRTVFQSHNIKNVILYGSRAIGNQHNGSDIDLTIEDSIELKKLLAIEQDLDKLNLPYKIDLSIKDHIKNESLIEHINRIGSTFLL
ncbi:MAG: nucleotidyltransferase family protein [Cyclobacteriaceae bacterium]